MVKLRRETASDICALYRREKKENLREAWEVILWKTVFECELRGLT